MATLSWEPKQLVLFYGCVKREYNGLPTLETTRLAWRLINPPWRDALALAEDSQPARKALRRESLQPTTIHSLSPDNTCQAVVATADLLTTAIFTETLWIDDARMRLPLTLQDETGSLRATFWSQLEFNEIVPVCASAIQLSTVCCIRCVWWTD